MTRASFSRSVSVWRSTSAKVTLPEEFAQEVNASDIWRAALAAISR